VAFADRIEPLRQIVDRIEQEMRESLAGLQRFHLPTHRDPATHSH
jgi:hypothetical protein